MCEKKVGINNIAQNLSHVKALSHYKSIILFVLQSMTYSIVQAT